MNNSVVFCVMNNSVCGKEESGSGHDNLSGDGERDAFSTKINDNGGIKNYAEKVHSRLNELRAYVFGSVEVGAELADLLKTAIPELPPTKRALEDLPSAGDEYENDSIPGNSDEEESVSRYAAEWNSIVCNGGESDYSDCDCDIHRILAESDED
ncbi:hypothetical protein R1sor_008837 [Riccia sorocarpa]|uniref:Uncharacterized protein n=1 Tax=Riccia sorocarpa TaxID=122646 RepID=A0ABD3H4C6_9MARC